MKTPKKNKGGRPKDPVLIKEVAKLIDPKTKKLKIPFRDAEALLTSKLERKVYLIQVQRAYKYALEK